MNEGLTAVVTLARLGLMTRRFLLCPVDDRSVSPLASLLSQEQISLMGICAILYYRGSVNEGLTSMVTLARLGHFPALPS